MGGGACVIIIEDGGENAKKAAAVAGQVSAALGPAEIYGADLPPNVLAAAVAYRDQCSAAYSAGLQLLALLSQSRS